MREITSHRTSELNEFVRVLAEDEPGPGGAHHSYVVRVRAGAEDLIGASVGFQKGAVRDVGVNGVSDEALLAIVADRLQCFQAGPFACRENALALTKIQEALHWLQHRTRDRMARGVEGMAKA